VIGGNAGKPPQYFVLQLAESRLTRRIFDEILCRIERLAWHSTGSRGQFPKGGEPSRCPLTSPGEE